MPSVLTLAAAQRAALEAADGETLARLVAAYGELWRRLADKAELLGYAIAALDAPTAGQVAALRRYRSLLGDVSAELDRFSNFAAVEINAAALAAIERAVVNSAALVDVQLPGVAFTALPAETIRTLLAFLQPSGPLFKRLEMLAPYTAQQVADTIVEKVALGLNPQQWAAVIRDEMGGGLTDAMRLARTVTNYAYREASRANYAMNATVVSGWYWLAQLDHDTCMSCVAQHGTLHGVDETLDDHWNGRAEVSGNVILSDDTAAFEALRYDGDIVIIRAASGKFLAVTPEHPVLTRRGWVAAAFVQEGDDVISSGGDYGASFGASPDKNNVPTRVENIPGALNMVRLDCVPEATKHFYRDGGDREIDAVFINRELWNGYNPALKQKVRESFFSQRHSGLSLSGLRGAYQRFATALAAAYSGLCGHDARFSFSFAHADVSKKVGFGRGMPGHAVLGQDASYGAPRHAELFGQGFFGNAPPVLRQGKPNVGLRERDLVPGVLGNFGALNLRSFGGSPKQPLSLEKIRESLLGSVPASSAIFRAITGQVVLDRVTDIGVRRFSGHVYSLQSRKEWYYSNGIISHNCAMVPAVVGFDNPIGTTGEDWFNQLPPEQQAEMMGPGKYAAWMADQFEFSALSATRLDDVWGSMHVEETLQNLVAA